MRSMTGFGVGNASCEAGRVVIEVRSVNHRFLDVRVRTTPEGAETGFAVEQRVRQRCQRGRYDISVRVETSAADLPFDVTRARRAYEALRALRDDVAPDTDLSVAAVLNLPFVAASSPAPRGPTAAALSVALESALDNLDAMRLAEGATLAAELSHRLQIARSLVAGMTQRLPDVVDTLAGRLRERIERALSALDRTADGSRLETEIALLADKADVTEELLRLNSHFDQFEAIAALPHAVGRRLDFLLQEMSRETNTIGAKSPDAQLSHWVVELKTEIERMREQVQNVE